MSNQKEIINMIKSISGQANVLTIPRVYIELTGDHLSALFLSQCVYWSDRGRDGWFYKSEKEWNEELGLSPYQVRRIREHLSDFIEIDLRKANGAPTMHYKVKIELLTSSIMKKLNNPLLRNSTIHCEETQQSLTETTTETTIEVKKEENIFKLYEQNIGAIPTLLVDDLADVEKEYHPEWIEAAFKIAVEKNARNWKYIYTVLKNWQAHGRDWTPGGKREPQIKSKPREEVEIVLMDGSTSKATT